MVHAQGDGGLCARSTDDFRNVGSALYHESYLDLMGLGHYSHIRWAYCNGGKEPEAQREGSSRPFGAKYHCARRSVIEPSHYKELRRRVANEQCVRSKCASMAAHDD